MSTSQLLVAFGTNISGALATDLIGAIHEVLEYIVY